VFENTSKGVLKFGQKGVLNYIPKYRANKDKDKINVYVCISIKDEILMIASLKTILSIKYLTEIP
jgi:hypothetical protein